jgi:hypothetical protein
VHFGPLAAALYRAHGENRYLREGELDIGLIRRKLVQVRDGHTHLERIAAAAGVEGYPASFDDLRDVLVLTWRMISRRVDPDAHPFPADRPWMLASAGVSSALRRPGLGFRRRVVTAGWFVAMAIVPRRAAGVLSAALLHPERRGRLGAAVTRLRWRKSAVRAGREGLDSGPVDRTAT